MKQETREGETERKESEKQEELGTHPNPFGYFLHGWL